MKRALITGITGQDGSYLAEFLLDKGYQVFGIIRRSSSFNRARIDHLSIGPYAADGRFNLLYGDLNDPGSIERILRTVKPDEVYNLGAQSHVGISFEIPEYTSESTGLGALRILNAFRETGLRPRFYQASSSELFGLVQEVPQTEKTPFYPRSPYACAKAYAFHITRNYREAYGFYACNGILFNHESPRRAENFVTRKITRTATRIKLGLERKLHLGNLDAKRDWGYAPEYVEAMWLMLQQSEPDDYVIATGETHTVREFVEETFSLLGLDWREYVVSDPNYLRPSEVELLLGDSSKAKSELGWEATTKFKDLVRIMVDADLELARQEGHMGTYTKRAGPGVPV
jgi:GDPmannose 4,6-dehydratase